MFCYKRYPIYWSEPFVLPVFVIYAYHFRGICCLFFYLSNAGKSPELSIDKDWIDIKNNTQCVIQMRQQIKKEINAAMQYMAMAAHFSRDTVNRPGFAKMFFESANEEREHAIKLISYLLMRGELTESLGNLLAKQVVYSLSYKLYYSMYY